MTKHTLMPPGPNAAEFGGLGPAARMVLTTDGTVTPMLEQLVGERIVTARLRHDEPATGAGPAAATSRTGPDLPLVRTTELVGARSGTVYIRARTVLAPDALPQPLRTDLTTTGEPIGRLLRKHRVESFRELVSCSVAGDGSAHRRYRVYIGGVVALSIEESFSPACFTGAG